MRRILTACLFFLLSASLKAADTVSISTMSLGSISRFVFSNRSDATGEAAVKKIDISAIPGNPSKVRITAIKWAVSGMNVDVLFDHTTDDRAIILNGNGEIQDANIKDPASSGDTGDILFTTTGHTAGDGYTIEIEVRPDGS